MLELEGLEIKRYDGKGLDDILRLHKKTFLPVVGEDIYSKNLDDFKKSLNSKRAFVASGSHRIIGFLGYRFVGENSETKNNFQRGINWARDKSLEFEFLEFMREFHEEIGIGEVCAEFYENESTRSNLKVQDSDIHFSEIAVHKEFRGNGIGEELINRIIECAQESGLAIYVNCWEGGYSSSLCEKLGFLPILRSGPRYNDGNAEKLMVRLLKNK